MAYFVSIFTRLVFNEVIFRSENGKANRFFRMYSYIISHILSFIPYFISRYLSRRKEKSDKNKLIENYISNKIPKNYKWKNLAKSILIVSLFGFFAEFPYYLFGMLSDKMYQIYGFGISSIITPVLIYIFSYCILKTYFYKHHYLSFAINSFCFLICFIIDLAILIQTKNNDYRYYINIILRILRLIFHCLLYCFSKKEFESSLLTPYSIIAFRSIYETIFLGVVSIPFALIPIKDFGKDEKEIIFVKFTYFFKGIRLLFTIILLILDYLIDLFIMLIIDKFSPSHLALALTLESIAEQVNGLIQEIISEKIISWFDYVKFGLYFIVFIGAMIHNEIIIINKWGLNEKTHLFLNKEFRKETIDNEQITENLDENYKDEDRESIEMSYVNRNDK